MGQVTTPELIDPVVWPPDHFWVGGFQNSLHCLCWQCLSCTERRYFLPPLKRVLSSRNKKGINIKKKKEKRNFFLSLSLIFFFFLLFLSPKTSVAVSSPCELRLPFFFFNIILFYCCNGVSHIQDRTCLSTLHLGVGKSAPKWK